MCDKSKLFFVIWTTTIWTLPGNLAIALHPDESYALVKAPNGEIYIMAEALVDKVMEVGGIESYEIVETHPGAFFENMLADHPFLPKTSRLVLADYVTMDSGTGCVHTAPGFGADDYQTCKRYGMDMVVPVDDQGRHTDYAGKYAGLQDRGVQPHHPGRHEGERRSVRLARRSSTPTPTAGAARTPSSSGPPRSGSAPWSPSRTRPAPPATTCAGCPPGAWTG